MNTKRWVVVAVVLGAWITAPVLAQRPASLTLGPCTLEDVEGRPDCGTLRVFENRHSRRGRQIDIYIIVLNALDGKGTDAPLFVLQGGPGQAATPLADFYGRIFKDSRRTRDIVLVDQRGTGKSHPLTCDFLQPTKGADPSQLLPPAAVRACRAELEKRADLRFYTTEMIVGDLDELRAALGHDQINIYGTSYGSRVAFEYIRTHPQRARAVVMKGIVPPGQRGPLFHARDGQRALDRLIARCAADETCRTMYPTLSADIQALFAKIEQISPSVTFKVRDGSERGVMLTRAVFGEAFRNLLYSPDSAAQAPLMIRRALNGDLTFFAQAYDNTRRALVDVLAAGMFLSVSCAEGAGSFSDAEIAKLTANTFLGDMRVREQRQACREWVTPSAPSVHDSVHSSVPVLMFSGEDDPVTPPSWGDQALKTLPRGRHIVVPNNGHAWGSLGTCGSAIAAAFIEQASAEHLDTSCIDTIKPVPFAVPKP